MASFSPLLVCLLLLQLHHFISAQTHKNVTLGSTLSTLDANSSWNSPSGDFSFGFRPNEEDHFLLAIWFAKIPEKTIVWTTDDRKPVQRGSKVQLTSNGILSLTSRNGTELWKAEPLNDGRQVTSAAMLDSGNFVLTSNDSKALWASFEHPTDTLLPGQILDLGGMIFSRVAEENYRLGRFQLFLQDDRNLVLYPLIPSTKDHYSAYWASYTVNNGSQLVFNQSGYIYLTLMTGGPVFLTKGVPVSTSEFFHRATLDFDGVFRQYTYPKSTKNDGIWNQSWSLAWSLPEDICSSNFGDLGSGVCGYNSYCRLQDERPTCVCPPGYEYSDPDDIFGGCKQNFVPPSCEANNLRDGVGYEMQEIPNTNWPGGNYEQFSNVNEGWCRETCLDDCACAAAVLDGGTCWLKRFPISHGRVESSVKTLIKVGNSSTELVPSETGKTQKEKDLWSVPALALLGSSAFLNILLSLLVLLFIYHSYQKKELKIVPESSSFGLNLRSFTYKELEVATNGFKEELGQGAFSTVYKGAIQQDYGGFVAIKRLDKLVRDVEKEFKAEMNAIGRTNHKNLVQLLGFCDEGLNRLLVYEYMRNGTLADFLFGSTRPDWSLRLKIAFGIARGLAYLHEDCSTQIIHCDVKPQNVLLDDLFVARISDFGLAKLLKTDQTRTTTAIRGTKGYVAPEWFKNMPITTKVDVYSFGIMLIEIICCRKNVELEVGSEDINILSEWAYECCLERKPHLLVENDEAAKSDRRLERLVMVAIWCIQEDPSLRPSMKKVTQMLEGAVNVPMPPDPSSFMSAIH